MYISDGRAQIAPKFLEGYVNLIGVFLEPFNVKRTCSCPSSKTET